MTLHSSFGPAIRSLSSLALCLCIGAVAGCGEGGGGGETGTVPEQLEALEVAGEESYEQVQHEGALTVSGKERDFQLQVDATAGPVSLTIHSPGMSDLSKLSGRTVTATLETKGLHEERSLLLADESGPLYVANVGHGIDADALFGAGFAQWGATVATNSDDLYAWEYTSAVFKTDDGDVSVEPGNTATIELDGATWRVAVIAAYKVTPHPDAALPCGGISDLLSYEMIRVEEAPEPTKLVRLSSAKLAHLGCME